MIRMAAVTAPMPSRPSLASNPAITAMTAEAQALHQALHHVEDGQRRVGLLGGLGIDAQRLVVGGRGPLLGSEGLDRLVVEEGVDHPARGLGVRLVQGAANGRCASPRWHEGEHAVDRHGDHGGDGEAPVIGACHRTAAAKHQLQRTVGARLNTSTRSRKSTAREPRSTVRDRAAGALGLMELDGKRQGVGEALRARPAAAPL